MISKGTWQNAATAFNALLLECGESLEELEFIVTQRYHHLDTLGLGTTQTLKDLFSMFDLTYTTRLRKLLIRNMASIKRESYDFLPAFLQNMTRTRSKSLRDLELRGFIPMKRRYDVDIPEGSSEEGDSEDQDESSSEEENHERAGTGDNEGLYEIPVDLMAMDTIFPGPLPRFPSAVCLWRLSLYLL
ncbi:hypothetical protein MPER_05228 [Moniliophthora perniciosa FA553]|nr:hypothetical protein MPER_05228 [Moniliophthora perniciosa FA553]